MGKTPLYDPLKGLRFVATLAWTNREPTGNRLSRWYARNLRALFEPCGPRFDSGRTVIACNAQARKLSLQFLTLPGIEPGFQA